MINDLNKVGRLKPDDEHHIVRVIIDGIGDVLLIPRERMEALISEELMIEIRADNRVYLAYTWQVKNMLEKWPWKKAGVWSMGE